MGYRGIAILMLLNAAIALGVVLYALLRARRARSTLILLSWLILICPVAGPVFLACGHLLSELSRKLDLDMEDINFSKQHEKVVLPPDSNAEMNLVPLNDAMAISDNGEVRKLLIDILKNDDLQALTGVARAIDDRDTEVSHYAAVAVLDSLSRFRANIQNHMANLRRYPDNIAANVNLLEYVHHMLEMNVMNDPERRSTINIEAEVAENLFQHNTWYMKGKHYLWLTDHLISVDDLSAAATWVERARRHYPDKLSTYKAWLHLAYARRDEAAFFECLAQIRASQVAVDKEIIDVLRVFEDRERPDPPSADSGMGNLHEMELESGTADEAAAPP